MLQADHTALVLVDVQGKLARVMHESEALIKNVERLIQGAQLLDIPIIWMEQYPEGLGPTTEQVKQHLAGLTPIAKKVFSASQSAEFQEEAAKAGRDTFLVAGIEAHICVYQTVRDLLADGKKVEVVVDAVSSRATENKSIALEKMQALGAMVTSVEMALFECLESAEHAQFKAISKLIK